MKKEMTPCLLLLFLLTCKGLSPAEAQTGAPTTSTDSNTPSDGDVVNTCPFVVVQHGRDGRDGLSGVQGPAGEKGEQGPVGVGEKGVRGEQGPVRVGEKGVRGEQGPVGVGEKGVRGEQGPVGVGEKGVRGEQGPVGVGEKGERGERGNQGYTGSQGPQGVTGARGDRGFRGPPGPTSATYIRWGRDDCPSTSGTQLLYAGRAAGEWYFHKGGGSEYLCLPNNPDYLSYRGGIQSGRGYLYGAEYQLSQSIALGPLPSSMGDHNAPCAVCYASTRGTVLMIPAKIYCPSGWTREYYGYLMTERYNHFRNSFACVDRYPESVPGSAADTNGALFYHVEAQCNGLPCPPYYNYKEVTCVVCSK